MRTIVIEDVKVGISVGGMACGPVPGHVVVEARILPEGEARCYYGMIEFEGAAYFFQSPESRFDLEIEENYDVEAFPGRETYEYSEFFGDYAALAQKDEAHALLLKYLICLARLPWTETEALKAASVGRALGTFDLPKCDQEEDFLEEQAEEQKRIAEEKAAGPRQVYVVEILREDSRQHTPFPNREIALFYADLEWNARSPRERKKFTAYRVLYTTRYWSDEAGPVYGAPEEVVKDYLAGDGQKG